MFAVRARVGGEFVEQRVGRRSVGEAVGIDGRRDDRDYGGGLAIRMNGLTIL